MVLNIKNAHCWVAMGVCQVGKCVSLPRLNQFDRRTLGGGAFAVGRADQYG